MLAASAVALTALAGLPAIHRALRLEEAAVLRTLEAQARIEAMRLSALLAATGAEIRTLARAPPVRDSVAAQAGGAGATAQGRAGQAAVAGADARDMAELSMILEATLDRAPAWRDIRLTSIRGAADDILRVARGPAADSDGRRAGAGTEAVTPQPVPRAPSATLVPGAGALGILRLAEPVRVGGDPVGAVVAQVDLDLLLRGVGDGSSGPGPPRREGSLRLVILSETGEEPLPERENDDGGSPRDLPRVAATDRAGPLTAEASIDIGSGPERIEIRVITQADPGTTLTDMRASLLAPLGAAALLIGAMAVLAAHRLTAPLATLASALASGRGVETAVARHLQSPDEIGAIARAVHALSRELVESTGRFATIFRHAPVGIVSCAVDGTILDMNPEAETMFGFTRGAALGQSLDILMPAAARGLHPPRLAAFEEHSSAMNADRDVSGLRQDGTEFPLSVAIGSVRVGERRTIIGILRDVSERHEAERKLAVLLAELEASKTELERSNEELDRFAYIASHDLKAPLRVIDNASRWLEEDLAEFLTEDTRESMHLLRSRVHRMERLLDDLLAYSRVGRSAHRAIWMRGTQILENVVSLVSPPEGFRVEIGPGFDAVHLPDMPISGVFLNLVSNAVKHHDRAEGLARVTVADEGATYVFTVEDDGPGIPEEYRERVFDMFQTLKPRDEVEGSGMGLALVRKTVESVSGTLSLSAGTDRGCVFRFTWPKPTDDREKDAA